MFNKIVAVIVTTFCVSRTFDLIEHLMCVKLNRFQIYIIQLNYEGNFH